MNTKALAALGLLGVGALTLYACRDALGTSRRRSRRLPTHLRRGAEPMIPLVCTEITTEQVESVTGQLSELSGRRVTLLLHTLGGYFQPVVQIARAVRRHGQVRAVVPYYALSGGTLVALAAQSLELWPHAALGPVDPQLGPFSAAALRAVIDSKPVEHVDDYTLALAHEARKSLQQTTVLLRELIGDNPRALQRLVAGEVPHSYPVTVEEAQALGLAVEVAAPGDNIRALIQALAPKGRLTWPLVQQ